MDDPNLKVVSHVIQKELLNLQGRSIVVDSVCQVSSGETVNIEVQKENNVDHIRRVRYHHSMFTSNITDPGKDFKNVPKLIIIYVTKSDIFRKGVVKYFVDSTLRSYGDIVDDGLTRIFINATAQDDSQLARLMKVFLGNKSFIDEFPKTHERIILFTEKQEGIKEMSEEVDELFGVILKKEAKELAKKMAKKMVDERVNEAVAKAQKEAEEVFSRKLKEQEKEYEKKLQALGYSQ